MELSEAAAVVAGTTFRDWTVSLFRQPFPANPTFDLCLRIEYVSPNNRVDDDKDITVAQMLNLPPLDVLDREALIEFIWMNIRSLVEHEAREDFYVDGIRVYDPHVPTGR